MKEQVISLETAKLAKERGFNIETNTVGYMLDGNYIGERGACVSCTEYAPAPTQSLLQKWLREVHKSVITIIVYNNGEEWTETEYQVTVSEFKHFTTHDSFVKSDFSTYEEALEVGLQEALKLI